MALTIDIHPTLRQIDTDAYRAFDAAGGFSVFYDWRFLVAAEHAPLLPVERTFYLCAREHGRLLGFVPAYLQRLASVDPLGLLERSAGLRDDGADLGLFSHVMHCWDSTVAVLDDRAEVRAALLHALSALARREGARHAGLLSVDDPRLLEQARDHGYSKRALVDRYGVDLRDYAGFDDFVRRLPNDGRWEMNRQLRKFEASGARTRVIGPPFDTVLERLCELCFGTTAKNGTPQYFPPGPLARWVRLCGDLMRLALVECDGELVGGFVCFEHRRCLYVWSAGMVYDRSAFSPYTLGMAAAYRYAFTRGLPRVEAGRLNERIKRRLGLRPTPLYSLVMRDLTDAGAGSNAAAVRLPVPAVAGP